MSRFRQVVQKFRGLGGKPSKAEKHVGKGTPKGVHQAVFRANSAFAKEVLRDGGYLSKSGRLTNKGLKQARTVQELIGRLYSGQLSIPIKGSSKLIDSVQKFIASISGGVW